MHNILKWTFFMFFLAVSPAASQPMAEGALHGSLAGATAGFPHDAWGMNPAAWRSVSSPTLVLFGSEGFNLSALRIGSIRAIWPWSFASIATGIQHYGNPSFGEQRVFVGAAHHLKLNHMRPIAVGGAIERQQFQIASYATKARWRAKLGWLSSVTPAIHIGLIYQGTLGRASSESRLDAGISGIMGPNFTWMAALSYHPPHPPSSRFGFALVMVEGENHAFVIRGGVSTNPESFSLGLGIRLNSIMADLAGAHHPVLGWTPGLSITLMRGEKA